MCDNNTVRHLTLHHSQLLVLNAKINYYLHVHVCFFFCLSVTKVNYTFKREDLATPKFSLKALKTNLKPSRRNFSHMLIIIIKAILLLVAKLRCVHFNNILFVSVAVPQSQLMLTSLRVTAISF